jgi:hypothetical protein
MKINIQYAIESIFNSYLSIYSYIAMPFQNVKPIFVRINFCLIIALLLLD